MSHSDASSSSRPAHQAASSHILPDNVSLADPFKHFLARNQARAKAAAQSLSTYPGRTRSGLPAQPLPLGVPLQPDSATNLRSRPGPLPDFIPIPCSPPSPQLTTVVWRGLRHQKKYGGRGKGQYEELITHMIRTALPELGVGSVEVTPEASPQFSSDEEASEDSAEDEGKGPMLSGYHVVRSPATFTSHGLRVQDTKESQRVWQLEPADTAQTRSVTCTAIGFEDKEASE